MMRRRRIHRAPQARYANLCCRRAYVAEQAIGAYCANGADSLVALKVDRYQAGEAVRNQALPCLLDITPSLDRHGCS